MSPIFRWLFPKTAALEKFPPIQWLLSGAPRALSALGVITYHDSLYGESDRTRHVWEEAVRRGIPIEQIAIFGRRSEYCRAYVPDSPSSSTKSWHFFESIATPPWIPMREAQEIDDKESFKRLFVEADLPVAHGYGVWTRAAALRAYRSLRAPVIVKPREGSRARHTSVRIATEAQLLSAYKIAKVICPVVMIEEFIPGILYRATCVNGALIATARLVRPMVVADGVMTAAELRDHYNAHKKFPNLTDVKDDWWFAQAIEHQGYKMHDVPEAGTRITLAEHSERANGGYFVDCTNEIPESTRGVIERAARVAGIPVIGFDILSEDLSEAGLPFTFIEGNSLPDIEIHDVPYEGARINVAKSVWDLWGLPDKTE